MKSESLVFWYVGSWRPPQRFSSPPNTQAPDYPLCFSGILHLWLLRVHYCHHVGPAQFLQVPAPGRRGPRYGSHQRHHRRHERLVPGWRPFWLADCRAPLRSSVPTGRHGRVGGHLSGRRGLAMWLRQCRHVFVCKIPDRYVAKIIGVLSKADDLHRSGNGYGACLRPALPE